MVAPVGTQSDPAGYLQLWGKARPAHPGPAFHPLLAHLLDVAATARELWRTAVPGASRAFAAEAFGFSDEATAEAWLVYAAGVHDLGKASPAFAAQDSTRLVALQAAGWRFPSMRNAVPHGYISGLHLLDLLRATLPGPAAFGVATAVAGHHGVFPPGVRTVAIRDGAGERWPMWAQARAWHETQLRLISRMAAGPTRVSNAGLLWLAGFIAVADWIGSDENYFPYVSVDDLLASNDVAAAYSARAAKQAAYALISLGFLAAPLPAAMPTFRDLGIATPNALQTRMEEIAAQFTESGIAIVEAPMGEGKTEAALFLASAYRPQGRPGLYFGLPTAATSNGMYGRFRDIVNRLFPEETINLQLLHGNAALSKVRTVVGDFSPVTPGDVARDGTGPHASAVAAEWFTRRRRGLLAPFGVGTIDQAMLAALGVKHVAVRHFGLAGKVVILDEIHAYDTYMTEIIARLLEWLAALSVPVILLSATLPGERRLALLNAYRRGVLKGDVAAAPSQPYPRITWSVGSAFGSVGFATSPRSRKLVTIRWIDDELEGGDHPSLGAQFCERLASGNCIAVICNTVRRAQDTYRALRADLGVFAANSLVELSLFHARFRARERERIETATLARFGPANGVVQTAGGQTPVARPARAVIVATQVIEQSLDLDFDLIVTDLAPIDLILQRLGRLHRHDRGYRAPPEIWIRRPRMDGDVPLFDRGSSRVYEPHILLRTWLALHDRSTISVPEDVEDLIEVVYRERADPPDGSSGALRAEWAKTRECAEKRNDAETREASYAYLMGPHTSAALHEIVRDPGEEDAPELHPALQARTRLGEPGIDLVLVRAGQFLDLETRTAPLSAEEVKQLLDDGIALRDRRVYMALSGTAPPPIFTRHAALRTHRLLRVSDAGEAPMSECILRDDPELGIVIRSTEEGDA